jgi:hypothetical protein
MVYSIFYYAFEAITKVIVNLGIKIYEWLKKAPLIKEKEIEKKAPTGWGFFIGQNPYGAKEYSFIGRTIKINASIPDLIGLRTIRANEGKIPEKLYFTFGEVASKNWFKEIEELSKAIEKGRKK